MTVKNTVAREAEDAHIPGPVLVVLLGLSVAFQEDRFATMADVIGQLGRAAEHPWYDAEMERTWKEASIPSFGDGQRWWQSWETGTWSVMDGLH